jgi:hypothetical protein
MKMLFVLGLAGSGNAPQKRGMYELDVTPVNDGTPPASTPLFARATMSLFVLIPMTSASPSPSKSAIANAVIDSALAMV